MQSAVAGLHVPGCVDREWMTQAEKIVLSVEDMAGIERALGKRGKKGRRKGQSHGGTGIH